MLLRTLVCLALLAANAAMGLRVLGVFPLGVYSHYNMFKAMMEVLAERGHEVVVFSPFPHKNANLTHIDTKVDTGPRISFYNFDFLDSRLLPIPGHVIFRDMVDIEEIGGNALCREVFSMPEFQRAMNGGYGKFDVVFTEIFASDCWAVVQYKLQIPMISMSSAPDVSWMHERVGSIDNPSYIVNVFADFPVKMTFWERVQNLMTRIYINYLHTSLMVDGSDEVVREFFGPNVPPIRELIKNTSLVLLNRHVSIHAARPLTPNVVHVGGLHLRDPPGALDEDTRRWMDEAEHGIIFFSLGSLMRADSMPVTMRDALLYAFSKLPQRVLWKFESEKMPLPPNVRIAKWLPQLDILTHPKTVLFITHGGLMGTLESLHSAVPMVGIPLFADQPTNMMLYRSLGIAEIIDRFTMTNESTFETLKKVTSEKRYRERAREVAALYRDRPRQAADEAVWWTEYVVRNHGAKHLRPLGADLPLYQYLLLDVVAFLAACALLTVFVLWRIVATLVRPTSKAATKKKKQS